LPGCAIGLQEEASRTEKEEEVPVHPGEIERRKRGLPRNSAAWDSMGEKGENGYRTGGTEFQEGAPGSQASAKEPADRRVRRGGGVKETNSRSKKGEGRRRKPASGKSDGGEGMGELRMRLRREPKEKWGAGVLGIEKVGECGNIRKRRGGGGGGGGRGGWGGGGGGGGGGGVVRGGGGGGGGGGEKKKKTFLKGVCVRYEDQPLEC